MWLESLKFFLKFWAFNKCLLDFIVPYLLASALESRESGWSYYALTSELIKLNIVEAKAKNGETSHRPGVICKNVTCKGNKSSRVTFEYILTWAEDRVVGLSIVFCGLDFRPDVLAIAELHSKLVRVSMPSRHYCAAQQDKEMLKCNLSGLSVGRVTGVELGRSEMLSCCSAKPPQSMLDFFTENFVRILCLVPYIYFIW